MTVSWVARALLIVAGLAASWFVAEDASIFPVVQMVIIALLVVAILFVLAFWPQWTARLTHFFTRKTS